MLTPFQTHTYTSYDRYPTVFKAMQEVYELQNPYSHLPVKILSFGCGTGKELKTLENLYFNHANFVGCDINPRVLEKASSSNISDKVRYFTVQQLIDSPRTFEIIFCMNVFNNAGHLPEVPINFADFNQAIIGLYKKLDIGCYLVVFNSNYTPLQTDVGKYFLPIKTPGILYSAKGVALFNKDGSCRPDDNFCIFKKIG